MVRNAEPGWPAEKGRSETAVWLRAAQKGLCEKEGRRPLPGLESWASLSEAAEPTVSQQTASL